MPVRGERALLKGVECAHAALFGQLHPADPVRRIDADGNALHGGALLEAAARVIVSDRGDVCVRFAGDQLVGIGILSAERRDLLTVQIVDRQRHIFLRNAEDRVFSVRLGKAERIRALPRACAGKRELHERFILRKRDHSRASRHRLAVHAHRIIAEGHRRDLDRGHARQDLIVVLSGIRRKQLRCALHAPVFVADAQAGERKAPLKDERVFLRAQIPVCILHADAVGDTCAARTGRQHAGHRRDKRVPRSA